MILFLNVGLFNQRLGPMQNREFAKNYDKIEVFKYSLSSLVYLYKWSKAIIYYQLGPEYADREKELQEYIETEFKDFNLTTRNYRNETPTQWKETFELFDENLIFYNCNHDHVFIDPDPSYFASVVKDFEHNQELISITWSHWPEYMSNSWSEDCYHLQVKDINVYDKYMTYKIPFDINSVNIINKNTYHYWWYTHDLPDRKFLRPDNFSDPIWHHGSFEQHMTVVPYREVGRHFDGYQHCTWKYSNMHSPVLEIPDGFFESNIKINYSTEYVEGKTNINPLNDNLRIFSPNGSDYNMHKNFIPIFWRKRISEFHDGFNYLDQKTEDDILKDTYRKRVLNTWSGMKCANQELHGYLQKIITHYLNLV